MLLVDHRRASRRRASRRRSPRAAGAERLTPRQEAGVAVWFFPAMALAGWAFSILLHGVLLGDWDTAIGSGVLFGALALIGIVVDLRLTPGFRFLPRKRAKDRAVAVR